MTDYELKNIDPEDIEDLLLKVETSFDIKFVGHELVHITTFGQLCDLIANKIQLDNSDDCTTQQAFYKLRNSLSATLNIDNNNLASDTLLTDLLPRQSRLSAIRRIETHLGLNLSILRPPHFVTNFFIITLFASIIGLIFSFIIELTLGLQIGLAGLVFSIGGLWLSDKFGKELDLKTVGQVAEKMTRENYLKSRRNSKTFNKKEIENVLVDWFSNELDLDKSKFTRDAKF